MALSSETRRNLDTLGIAYVSLEEGGFYQGVLPGGFSDVKSLISFPGPKVEFKDEFSREILAFKEIPEPVQIPHVKISKEKNDRGILEERENSFLSMDQDSLHQGILDALQTGVIRYVPDDEMAEKYPETWANRQVKKTWRGPNDKPQKSAHQLVDEAEQSDDYARHAHKVSAHVKATQAAVLGGHTPPKPLSK
jgi:hypothetical protein